MSYDVLRFPVPEDSPVSQRFGENLLDYTKYGMRGHNGIDWAVNLIPIWSAAAGVVGWTGYDSGYGRMVGIKHDYGTTIYGHLTSYAVKAGDSVQAGDVIGISGGGLDDPRRGNSTGPHLHFGYRPDGYDYANGFLGYIDPWTLLVGSGGSMSDEVKYTGVVVATYGVRVRSGPGTNYSIIGNGLPNGAQVQAVVLQMVGSDNWLRLWGPTVRWVAAVYGGNTLVDYKPVAAPTPTAPEFTLVEKVEKLWAAHPELQK